jgi:Na+-driven multidrug efflux pump
MTSAILAFLRTVVFQISLILTLPLIWQLDGVWFSSLFAEVLALISTAIFILIHRKKYGYL